MSPVLGDLYHGLRKAISRMFLRHKRLTIRHVAFFSSIFLALCVLYYTFSPWGSTDMHFPQRVYSPPINVPPEVWENRASEIKKAFLHAYHGYERYASPHDELKPVSNTPDNK